MQSIVLDGYFAELQESPDMKYLYFGTWGSYGIEEIFVEKKNEWIGKTITATFSHDEGLSIEVIVPDDGHLRIPPEVTASAYPKNDPGKIVFSTPLSEDSKLVSTDILFVVLDHAPIDGDESDFTPSQYDQLLSLIESKVPQNGTEGQVLTKGADGNYWSTPSGSGGGGYVIGHGLKLDPDTNTLSVNVANSVEADNTLPITSAAVQATVGNIEVLLGTI